MKRLVVGLITLLLLAGLVGCGANDVIVDVVTNDTGKTSEKSADSESADKEETKQSTAPETNAAGLKTLAKKDIKVGVLYIGSASDTSGYTYAHELGIQGMKSNIGLSEDQIVRKENIDDSDEKAIDKALKECVEEGCNIIFTTSWGYMDLTESYAEKYPDIYFAHGTGYKSNGKNFTNYFGRIYQSRYLSGIVAGLKTKSDQIGYVSAMGTDNSECTGGVDAFALGVESVNKNAKVKVAVTNSWYSPDDEKAAAKALVEAGCDVLAQHCDTTAPQEVSEENGTWSIGYNSDMSKETPKATLTSVIWNWSAYYTSFVNSVMDGSYDGSNYYGGMQESLVSLTPLADFCADDTAAKVAEAQQKILSGSFGVFDGVLKTNKGKTVGKDGETLSDETITGGIDWYYHNVEELNWK
ncbi:MAG: BMP family ABC transporter substrate-binding protein [Lachnospiraceae bacterium]|nr:BMP family ABC transporter substrate-binding protein [Lachnospiraceae bacterium]